MQLKQGLRIADLPALGFAIAAFCGALLALFVPLSPSTALLISVALLVCGLIAILFAHTRRFGSALTYGTVAAIVCFQAETQISRSDRALLARLDPDTAIVACRGVVVLKEEAKGAALSDKLWLNEVRIEFPDTVFKCKNLRVRLRIPLASAVGIEIGDVVACAVRIESAHHRHMRSTRELMWSLREGHWADARIADPNSLVVVEGNGGIRQGIATVRNAILDVFAVRLSPDASAVAGALLLGSRETFSGEFREDLQSTGLAHLFALSGLNTGLLVSLCWLVLSWLFVPRRTRYVILLLLLTCYTLLGLGVPSLFRSAMMAGLLVLGRLLAKPSHPANLLLFAFAIELLFWPLHLLDAGFLLSYLSMAGILAAYIALSQPIQDLLIANMQGFRRRIADTLSSTIGAQLATAPVVGMLFTRVPGLAILANLFAIPVFSLLVVLTILLLLLHPIFDVAAVPIARAIEGIVWAFAKITSFISDVPGASFELNVSIWIVVITIATQFMAIVYCLRAQLRAGLLWILASLNLLIWPGYFVSSPIASCHRFGERTESLFLIQVDKFACIAGFGAEWEGERNMGLIRERLSSIGIKSIDAAIVASERAGEIGGAPVILKAMRPNGIWDFAEQRHTLTASRFRAAVEFSDIRVVRPFAGDTMSFDETGIKIAWPPRERDEAGGIVLLEHGTSTFLIHFGVDSTQITNACSALSKQGNILFVNLDNANASTDFTANHDSRMWIWQDNGWQSEISQGQRLMQLWSNPGSETV